MRMVEVNTAVVVHVDAIRSFQLEPNFDYIDIVKQTASKRWIFRGC